MYATLSSTGRDAWHKYVQNKLKDAPFAKAHAIPGGYQEHIDEKGMIAYGPAAGAWLESISEPGRFISDNDRIHIAENLRSNWQTWMGILEEQQGENGADAILQKVGNDPDLGPTLAVIAESKWSAWLNRDNPAKDVAAVRALFQGLQASDGLTQYVIESAFGFLDKDLMSRTAWVGAKSAAMGAMRVHKDGEQAGMAIVELRQLAKQPGAGDAWKPWLEAMTYRLTAPLSFSHGTPD